ncbi:hypothetical protein [Sulfitobacter sp. MF3-043]|uniref:hypothetical protein n=1 Tax=Sulfitobacter sediminivivens TaxID=3252902 RepID=UPI0036D7F4FD
MIDRPHPLTIHLSADEMIFLEKGAEKINAFMAESHPPNFPGPLGLTPEQMVVWLVEKAHGEFREAMEKT